MPDYQINSTAANIDKAVANANLMLLTGAADPTTATVGTLGQIYKNTTTGALFRCTAVSATYTWVSLIVNDLTTGGTKSALSAEQGVELSQQISQLGTFKDTFNLDAAETYEVMQILSNGNFATAWSTTNSTHSVANNIGSFTASAQYGRISNPAPTVSGHKYYIRAFLKTSTDQILIQFVSGVDGVYSTISTEKFTMVSGIITASITGNSELRIRDLRASDWDEVQVQNVIISDDLTARYGAGSEPTAELYDLLMSTYNNYAWFEPNVAHSVTPLSPKAVIYDGVKYYGIPLSSVSPLTGQTIVCFGDSITEGQTTGDYTTHLANRTGAAVVNVGFGGCCMAYHTIPAYDAFSMTKLADSIASGDFSLQIANQVPDVKDDNTEIVARLTAIDWDDVDIIVINYMTNDFRFGVPLGAIADTDSTSFYGAVHYVIDKILTAYPHIKMAFVSAPWRARQSIGDGKDADNYPNDNGAYLSEFVDAEKAVAEKHKIPYHDLYRTSGINSYTHGLYLYDGLHPSHPYGDELIGNRIGAFLLTIY